VTQLKLLEGYKVFLFDGIAVLTGVNELTFVSKNADGSPLSRLQPEVFSFILDENPAGWKLLLFQTTRSLRSATSKSRGARPAGPTCLRWGLQLLRTAIVSISTRAHGLPVPRPEGRARRLVRLGSACRNISDTRLHTREIQLARLGRQARERPST